MGPLVHVHTHTQTPGQLVHTHRADMWMSVSVCWERLSSPCFWARCQAQLPAVRGQGNTMAPNVAHYPPSVFYQLRKQRRTQLILKKHTQVRHICPHAEYVKWAQWVKMTYSISRKWEKNWISLLYIGCGGHRREVWHWNGSAEWENVTLSNSLAFISSWQKFLWAYVCF